MDMLVNRGEMFGLEMVNASSGDLKRGTIYVTLQRMMDKGYLDSGQDSRTGSANRPVYKPTRLGEAIFKAQELALKYLALHS